MNTDNVTALVNNGFSDPMIWLFVVLIIFTLFILIKQFSLSRESKRSFKDLHNKIDNLYRTTDAFKELNVKIDNLNRSTEELKKSPLNTNTSFQ
jgi:biopolymer transport protein ExbB/TolQ